MNGPARHSMPQSVSRKSGNSSRHSHKGPRSKSPQGLGLPPLPPVSDDKPMDYHSMKGVFGWTTLDSVSVPYILRHDKQYVAVKMVEQKLLSKFPSTYPKELESRPPLMSQYITQPESRLLNEINLKHCAAEFGKQPFTTQDLVVSLEDFGEFYNLVKSLFTKPKFKIQGGWLQINNTVAPYVLRGRNQSKYLPLSVVRYAAGLLKNPDVKGLACSEEECAYLAGLCKGAGLKVVFHLEKTRLIELRLLETLCKSNLVVIELPGKSSPFDYAEYKDEIEKRSLHDQHIAPKLSMPPPPPIMRGGPPNVTMVGFDLPLPMTTYAQGLGSIALPPRSMRPTYPPPSAATGAPPKINTPPFIPEIDYLAKMNSGDKSKSSDAPIDLTASVNTGRRGSVDGPKTLVKRTKDSSRNNSPSPLSRADPTHDLAARVASRMQKLAAEKSGVCSPTAPSPRSSMSTPTMSTSPAITPMDFHGKTISCLERDAGQKIALVEAICRVYFPTTPLAEFINGLENILSISLGDLVGEEEKSFIQFYGLPTNNLKCSKVLKLSDLDFHMPQLLYMFQCPKAEKEVSLPPTDKSTKEPTQTDEEPTKQMDDSSSQNNNNNEAREIPQTKRPSTETDVAKVPKKSRKLDFIVNRIYQSRPSN